MRHMEVRWRRRWSDLDRWRREWNYRRISLVRRLPWSLLKLATGVAESFLRRPNLGHRSCAHLGFHRVCACVASRSQSLDSGTCSCVCLDAGALQRSLCLSCCPMLSQPELSLRENLLPLENVSDAVFPGNPTAFRDRCNFAFQLFHFARLSIPVVGLHAGVVGPGDVPLYLNPQ